MADQVVVATPAHPTRAAAGVLGVCGEAAVAGLLGAGGGAAS